MTVAMEFAITMPLSATPTIVIAPTIMIVPSITIPVSAKPAIAPALMIPVAMPATSVEASAIPAGMTPIPVVPRAHANEYAVHEPLRAVIAIGRAGVRIIIIVAVSANRGRPNISWPYSNAHNDSLRARKRSAKEANPE